MTPLKKFNILLCTTFAIVAVVVLLPLLEQENRGTTEMVLRIAGATVLLAIGSVQFRMPK